MVAPAGSARMCRAVGPIGQAFTVVSPGTLKGLGQHDFGLKATIYLHHIHIRVAIVAGRERNRPAIWRKRWGKFIRWVRRQAHGVATVAGWRNNCADASCAV